MLGLGGYVGMGNIHELKERKYSGGTEYECDKNVRIKREKGRERNK